MECEIEIAVVKKYKDVNGKVISTTVGDTLSIEEIKTLIANATATTPTIYKKTVSKVNE